jgi:hypothetical protein
VLTYPVSKPEHSPATVCRWDVEDGAQFIPEDGVEFFDGVAGSHQRGGDLGAPGGVDFGVEKEGRQCLPDRAAAADPGGRGH